jgi:hypothetical protein
LIDQVFARGITSRSRDSKRNKDTENC